jgi:hypothetical protein
MAEKIISPGVFQNESDQSLVQRGIQGTATAIVGPTVKGIPFVPTYVTSYTEFASIYGETFKSGSYYYEYLTSIAAKEYFQNGGNTLLVTRITNGSGSVSTYASASVTSTNTSASFGLETLAWGDTMNNVSTLSSGSLPSGSSVNVRWEITNVNTGSGTFSLAVRQGNDNDAQKNYIETWPNLSLDPSLPNYISRVIGDAKYAWTYNATDGTSYIQQTGSYNNVSKYIRIASVATPQVDSIDNNGTYKASYV